MKELKSDHLIASVPTLFSFRAMFHHFLYRVPMRIEEVMIFQTSWGQTGYYVCPRCKVTMEREFMSFCNRCGQCLDWSDYKNAMMIEAGKH